jgi:hypothetical protein
MKSIIPDPAQLDELAAGLDAGWDEEPQQASASQPPVSASQPPQSPSQPPQSLPPSLDALDADWGDSEDEDSGPGSTDAEGSPERGSAPLRPSKRERREVERKRRAHQAQQNTASKKQRKAERLAAARQTSERQRAAEQQALAERQKRQSKALRKRPAKSEANETAAAPPKRVVKRTRREEPRAAAEPKQSLPVKSEPRPVVVESGLKKLIVPLMLAILIAVTLGFALSRAR